MKSEAMAAIVELEIQREGVRFDLGNLKAHDLGAIAAPVPELGGLETQVADADDVHLGWPSGATWNPQRRGVPERDSSRRPPWPPPRARLARFRSRDRRAPHH